MATPTARARQLDLSPQESSVAAVYASGASIAETAERLGLTVQTVKSYLKRAREKYRERGVDASTQLRLSAALLADQETPPPRS